MKTAASRPRPVEPASSPGERSGIPVWPGIVLAALCALIYISVGSGGTFRVRPSQYIHHTLTAAAWLQGRLYVTAGEIERQYMLNELHRGGYDAPDALSNAELRMVYRQAAIESMRRAGMDLRHLDAAIAESFRSGAYHDWVRMGERYYAYWPPLPALVMLPFVACFGPGCSDILVGNLLGAVSAFFIYLMLRALGRQWPALDSTACVWLTLFYCLGTCHMYQACMGQVWLITQLCGTLFLIIAAWLGFESIGRRWLIVPAAVALGLGFLGRSTIILAAPFFGVVLWIAAGPPLRWRRYAVQATIFLLPLLVAIGVQLAFNKARFGDPLDFGQGHLAEEGGDPMFSEDYKTFGRFNLHYVPGNVWFYFLNPEIRPYPTHDPAQAGWTFDPRGNSLFLVSPAMVYLFACGRQRRRDLLAAVIAGALPGTATLMLFHGTGWYQFGQRYLLDVMPFLLVLAAFGIRGRITRLPLALMLLSFAVNAWGTYRFHLERG